MSEIEIEYEEKRYFFKLEGHTIRDSSFMVPAKGLLQSIREKNTQKIYDELKDLPVAEKQRHAGFANDNHHHELTLLLARDCMESNPNSPAAVATYISALRKSNQSREAIRFYDAYKSRGGSDNAAVCTALGAAYLDINDVEEAERQARRAQGLNKRNRSPFISMLWKSIDHWREVNGH